MKIIEWNCQGAFRKKNSRILSLQPDILVVPECEPGNKLKFGKLTPKPFDFFWYGTSGNKGIGIFAYGEYTFELLKAFNPRFKFVIPIKVTGKNTSFLLFAIWTQDNAERPDERYIGQVWMALNYYSHLLSLPVLLTGDFNSNKIWDRKKRVGNHSDVVKLLTQHRIFSLYHKQNNLEHGQERHPTFFMYRKTERPYHIDYFFASEILINKGFNIITGEPDNWLDISDHVPLILDFEPDVFTYLNNSISEFIDLTVNAFSNETKSRFADRIKDLIREANRIEKYPPSIAYHQHREKLITKLEYLIEIDKLINLL